MVYAELSVRFERIEDLEAVLDEAGIALEEIPRAAGGSRNGVLPDFLIGAHAAVAGMSLLTRDIQRYRTYFPSITLITPET